MHLDTRLTGLDEAAIHLQQCLRSATKLRSRSLILQATTLLALIADLQDDPDRDHLVSQWEDSKSGNANDLAKVRHDINGLGEIVKLVGVRVAEGW